MPSLWPSSVVNGAGSIRVRPPGKAARKARAPGSASDKRTARPATVEEASCRSQEAMSSFSVNAFCLKLNAVSRVRGLAVPST